MEKSNINAIIQKIFSLLTSNLPSVWDGKETILYMKQNLCRNWKQMEWPGWYFQFICEKVLNKESFFSIPGPKFGNVEFDGFCDIPWDFKAHTSNTGCKVPTNGYEETSEAIEKYGCVGFIIANGEATFDEDQSFKLWHDSLKGNISAYEEKRIERGAKSRRRKSSFKLQSIDFVILDKSKILLCQKFQGGMRNSNGVPRNEKVMLDLSNPELGLIRMDFKK